MPVFDDIFSEAKVKQYEKLLQILECGDVIDKTRKITPPMQLPSKRGRDMIQELVWGEMGSFVRMLLWEEEGGDG